MGLVKNANHFTVFSDKLLNRISDREQLDTYEISNHVERTYIGLLFMEHGDTETGLEKLSETFNDLDYTNKLIQVSVDGSQHQLETIRRISRWQKRWYLAAIY